MTLFEQLVPGDAARAVELVRANTAPVSFADLARQANLPKPVKRSRVALKAALEQAADEGAVFRWPAKRFWHRAPEAVREDAVLAVAAEVALPLTELVKRAGRDGPGFSQALVKRTVSELVADGRLRAVPPFASSKVKLLMKAGSDCAYAASARVFLEAKFREAGVDLGTLFGPPPPAAEAKPDVPAMILEAMQHVDPTAFERGYPVSAWRLRKVLAAVAKPDFDAAALELRKRERVFLDLHHDPNGLPAEQKDELVDGGDGTYYVTITIRR